MDVESFSSDVEVEEGVELEGVESEDWRDEKHCSNTFNSKNAWVKKPGVFREAVCGACCCGGIATALMFTDFI